MQEKKERKKVCAERREEKNKEKRGNRKCDKGMEEK